MHDIRAIRDDAAAYVSGWSSRGVADAEAVVASILDLDAKLRAAQTSFQAAQARRNEASKLIGAAKAQKDEAKAQGLMAEVAALKGEIEQHAADETKFAAELKDVLAALPNLAAADVPDGADEAGNVEVRRWSDRSAVPAGKINATPKDHVALGEALGMMDFEAAAKMSGARFVVLKQDLARLERALGQFMLDLQTEEHGYTEVSPPLLVKDEALFGTGQLPKFSADLFKTESMDVDRLIDVGLNLGQQGWLSAEPRRKALRAELSLTLQGDDLEAAILGAEEQLKLEYLAVEGPKFAQRIQADEFKERRWLIPTAEVSLTNLVREQITAEEELPMRLTALTPSFRSEAGASGRDTRGMIRQHQFYKVELVSITTPEASNDEHERMVGCAEEVLKRLELPFRTMILCKGDMGFTARKTYDLEVWLPSQNTYREISSCSNCGDFQARRMDARTKKAGEKGGRFLHTLNGSGLAVGRTLVAVMENYQDEGGRIAIPAALQPYMRGTTHIGGGA
jgi:seryl-tRNA synthetase